MDARQYRDDLFRAALESEFRMNGAFVSSANEVSQAGGMRKDGRQKPQQQEEEPK